MMNKTAYSLADLMSATPVHPGEMIKDELEARGISQRRFAAVIGCSSTVLNEILNGKRPVTPDYALRIEAALGIKAYLLIDLQSQYNLQNARQDTHLSILLNKIRASAAVL